VRAYAAPPSASAGRSAAPRPPGPRGSRRPARHPGLAHGPRLASRPLPRGAADPDVHAQLPRRPSPGPLRDQPSRPPRRHSPGASDGARPIRRPGPARCPRLARCPRQASLPPLPHAAGHARSNCCLPLGWCPASPQRPADRPGRAGHPPRRHFLAAGGRVWPADPPPLGGCLGPRCGLSPAGLPLAGHLPRASRPSPASFLVDGAPCPCVCFCSAGHLCPAGRSRLAGSLCPARMHPGRARSPRWSLACGRAWVAGTRSRC